MPNTIDIIDDELNLDENYYLNLNNNSHCDIHIIIVILIYSIIIIILIYYIILLFI